MKISYFTILALFIGTSALAEATYGTCRINNGQKGFCEGWYNGKAVVKNKGSYETCRINNGQKGFCEGWYNGKAVVKNK